MRRSLAHYYGLLFLLALFASLLSPACSGDDDDDDTLPANDDDSTAPNDDDSTGDDDDSTAPNDDDSTDDDDDTTPPPREHPFIIMTAAQREIAAQRAVDPLYAPYFDGIRAQGAAEYNPGDPAEWQSSPEQGNARTALANAFLAYVLDDEAAGAKAKEFLLGMRTDFDTNLVWDSNIRVPSVTLGYTGAWDLLSATDMMTPEESDEIRQRIVAFTDSYFDRYLGNPMQYRLMLVPTQNNHNLKTACSVAIPALAFPEEAEANGWTNWVFSEMGYLTTPIGHYMQLDGGVSEGTHYWQFALNSLYPVLFALENMGIDSMEILADCRLRNDELPWSDHGCVEGAPITFQNPLHTQLFRGAVDWFVKLRLPSGEAPPIDDGDFNAVGFIRLFDGVWDDASYLTWHWLANDARPGQADKNGYESIYSILRHDLSQEGAPPTFPLFQYLPNSGNAVFRSGWDSDALYFSMTSEPAPSRMTVHDHIDNNHVQLAAFGEYLLMDSGYYKPNELDNAITAHAANHSLVLVDGMGAIDKGRLINYGGEDAFLENPRDGLFFDYVEGRTRYSRQETDWTRSALSVGDRYVVLADFLSAEAEHAYTYRMHGYGGYDSGGTFDWLDTGLGGRWERPKAGVDVSVVGTSPVTLAEAPTTGEGSSDVSVHVFDIGRNVQHHFVMDANATGQDIALVSTLFPYRVGAESPADSPAQVTALAAPNGWAALRVTHADGRTDVAVVGPGGVSGVVNVDVDGTLRAIETNGRLALLADIGGAQPHAFVAPAGDLSLDGAPIAMECDATKHCSRE